MPNKLSLNEGFYDENILPEEIKQRIDILDNTIEQLNCDESLEINLIIHILKVRAMKYDINLIKLIINIAHSFNIDVLAMHTSSDEGNVTKH